MLSQIFRASTALPILLLSTIPTYAEEITPAEARELAEEAYVFGFGIVENYKSMFGMSVYEPSPQYGGFNNYVHARALFGPDYDLVVSPNNDTLYSTTWADLRAEPLAITVPRTGERYFVIQLVDMFTDNFAYIGTRATGRDGGTFLLVGPSFDGPLPEGDFDRVIVSRSDFAALATRTAVDGPDDVADVTAFQDQLQLAPLSAHLGTEPPTAATAIDFPIYDASAFYGKPELLGVLNQLLEWEAPRLEESALMARLSAIDVGPYRTFDLAAFPQDVQTAIAEGTAAGHAAIEEKGRNLSQDVGGWLYTPPMGDYGTDYLFRSAVAWKFIYTNSPAEALYPIAETDAEGAPLTGAASYILEFPAGELPPVDAFWSLTIYDSESRLMVENPIDRYSIGDRTEGLESGEDGSLRILIQHDDPGAEHHANWLPAPEGGFYIIARLYMPQQPAQDGRYRLPAIEKQ
ncbi:DUF1254 domain-containing protein (plasmid) [Salipiger sp. H15]|uniref:DUF1254 domain-containing protein n=1 Tax=Alloyangia sp. H15 TaxID=3029062 RepID=A0AAU8ATI3_9RHOB